MKKKKNELVVDEVDVVVDVEESGDQLLEEEVQLDSESEESGPSMTLLPTSTLPPRRWIALREWQLRQKRNAWTVESHLSAEAANSAAPNGEWGVPDSHAAHTTAPVTVQNRCTISSWCSKPELHLWASQMLILPP